MKAFLTIVLTIIILIGFAQSNLIPGKNSFDKKWIKNTTYQMTWSAMRDNAKFELGKITVKIFKSKKTLTAVSMVNMKNMNTP